MNDQKKTGCQCPYCEAPLFDDLCQPCEVKVVRCSECGKPLPKDSKECPECGGSEEENQGG